MDSAVPMVAGYDGSPTARAAVEWAAAHSDAEGGMIVITVVVGTSEAQRRLARAQLRELLADPILSRCAWRGEVCAADSAAEGLLAAAHEHGASAIVVGSHGCGSAAAPLGGTADRLVHQCDLPVVVIPR